MISKGPVTIALDTMSGAQSSTHAIRAAAKLSMKSDAPEILLLGNEHEIGSTLDGIRHDAENLAIFHTQAADSALSKACTLVKEARADALVSAAPVEQLRTTCKAMLTKMDNVDKQALCAVFPTEKRRGAKEDPFSLILDIGFETTATTQNLVHYALMGAAYAQVISQNSKPSVALLASSPTLAQAPTHLQQAAATLHESSTMNFIGLLEPVDIPLGKADVIVSDGFVGNMALKLLESSGSIIKRLITYAHRQKILAKAGLMMLGPALTNIKSFMDWQEYGGAPLLGYEQLCIKLAVNASEQAHYNALKVTQKAITNDFLKICKEAL
ncbi:MAG: hypothetical protein QGI45_12445 [Myxococcota bacterium]|jgi:glycerol-3-phosphate acyltransferase PlsX|nr:hypothetical protein [Myxococcota bacterium]